MSSQPGIDMSDVAEEMNREPLSRALFENAQLRVLVRQLNARVQVLESATASDKTPSKSGT